MSPRPLVHYVKLEPQFVEFPRFGCAKCDWAVNASSEEFGLELVSDHWWANHEN